MYDAIDCEGFAGGFTLGTVQAGFRLVGKRELPGGFGVQSCEVNRHLLGDDWVSEIGPDEGWTAYDVAYVFGNPPCSGFSLLSSQDFRGIDSPINSCMWSLTHFAARCQPEFLVFESVQPAYKQGRPLMQALRLRLEELTGRRYDLTHVLHNAGRVGGAAIRARYFFVCHAVPFGVEDPNTQPQTVRQAIGDLAFLENTLELQPYRGPASRWAEAHHAPIGAVDGHVSKPNPVLLRAYDLMEEIDWPQGDNLSMVSKAYYEKFGRLPASWDNGAAKLIANDFRMGFYQLHRWHMDRPTRVVTGAACQLVLHPEEPRALTLREVARIQGFPDDWTIRPLVRKGSFGKAAVLWGKGIAVQTGRWISGWVKQSLDGQPGSLTGTEVGDREFLVDLTRIERLPGSP